VDNVADRKKEDYYAVNLRHVPAMHTGPMHHAKRLCRAAVYAPKLT
jgi:hypothetical protein